MADYAGAVKAMRDRFEQNWTLTPVMFQNEKPTAMPWPPQDSNGNMAPWVYFEVLAVHSELRGAGLPGNQTWLTRGYINVHVFTREGYGYEGSLQLTDAAGEIFRSQTFYRDGQGAKVLCMAPMTDGGASDADNGNAFRVTTAIPFEFYFIK